MENDSKRGRRVAVYCSSMAGLPDEVAAGARLIASAIGESGGTLVYGGVDAGLMHIVAQAAHESGARVCGVVPEVFSHRADALCDEIVATPDLNVRKARMIGMSDVFVVLPGGIGTIDEWVSTLSEIMIREKATFSAECADPDKNHQTESPADCPILVWNHGGMYDGIARQLEETAASVYARGRRVDRSIIFTGAGELAEYLRKILSD